MDYPGREEDIQELMQKGKVFYKFSKSRKEFTEHFEESFYREYPENSIIRPSGYHGLSICDDISKLLLCACYGDQLTQIIIDEESPYIEDIKQKMYKEPEEYGKFGEYVTFVTQTGKNYSLSDITVINELIQTSSNEALDRFLYYTNLGKPMEQIYSDIGFEDAANFVKTLKRTYMTETFSDNPFFQQDPDLYLKYAGFYIANDRDHDRIREIANELTQHIEQKFTFQQAEIDYEAIKHQVVDRRREPKPLVKIEDNPRDRRMIAVYFLHANDFTKNQADQIMKILESQNAFVDCDKINTLLPLFDKKMSDAELRSLKKTLSKGVVSTEEMCDAIEYFYNLSQDIQIESKYKKLSLVELIADKTKESLLDRFNKITQYDKAEIEDRYR